MTAYIDASVIVPAFVREASSIAVRQWLTNLAAEVFISDFAAGEFASAISRRVRMGEIEDAVGLELLAAFDLWVKAEAITFPTPPQDIEAATVLVRRFELKLRLPDAIHLAACQRRGLTLATLDDGLADAARAVGVAHICPA